MPAFPWPQARPCFGSGLFSSLCFPFLLPSRGLAQAPFPSLLDMFSPWPTRKGCILLDFTSGWYLCFFLPHHNSDLPPPVDWKNKNKNNIQPKSWEFYFIQWPPWGFIAQDSVSQRVLRNYSKEVREDQDIQEFWLKKKCSQTSEGCC